MNHAELKIMDCARKPGFLNKIIKNIYILKISNCLNYVSVHCFAQQINNFIFYGIKYEIMAIWYSILFVYGRLRALLKLFISHLNKAPL